jgi:hypothetical protein
MELPLLQVTDSEYLAALDCQQVLTDENGELSMLGVGYLSNEQVSTMVMRTGSEDPLIPTSHPSSSRIWIIGLQAD